MRNGNYSGITCKQYVHVLTQQKEKQQSQKQCADAVVYVIDKSSFD